MPDLRKEHNLIKKISVWFDSESVIVLTMGKVGTLTICNSLDKIGKKHVHPHSLRHTKPGIHFLKNIKLPLYKNLFYFYKTLTKRIKVFFWLALAKEVTIITGVRDPFSRAISAFFEQSHYLALDPKAMKYEDVNTAFEKHYDIEGGLHWFDNEINRVFGIDVFKPPFNKDQGYQIIEQGKLRIFIYRIDFLNNIEPQLREFIGDESFEIVVTNETVANKNYNKLKANKAFSESEFALIKESKYMKHFYTNNEIEELKDKWIKNN